MAPRIGFTLEPEVLPLERNGVVEEELRSVLESLRENIFGEITEECIRGVGKQEANVLGWGFREDGGESGEGIVGTDIDARDGAIRNNENSSDRIDVLLDLSCNTLRLESVLLMITSVG